jgi:hypothetical protein
MQAALPLKPCDLAEPMVLVISLANKNATWSLFWLLQNCYVGIQEFGTSLAIL